MKISKAKPKRLPGVALQPVVRPNLNAARGTWLIIQYALTEAIAKQQKDAADNQRCLEGIKRQLDDLKSDLGNWPNVQALPQAGRKETL